MQIDYRKYISAKLIICGVEIMPNQKHTSLLSCGLKIQMSSGVSTDEKLTSAELVESLLDNILFVNCLEM